MIIPVYNTEKYLQRCIDSCVANVKHHENEIEIILVNDGTKDNSNEIIKRNKISYPFIKSIEQSNQGLSIARNNGLTLAKGDFIWFIDSDDCITNGCIDKIWPHLNSTIDVLTFDFRFIYNNGTKTVIHKWNTKYDKGSSVLKEHCSPMGAQFYIYRRAFLIDKNLKFLPYVYHEDNDFNFRMLYSANKIKKLDIVAYDYYQYVTGTITSEPNIKRSLDLIKIAARHKQFIEDHIPNSEHKYYLRYVGLCLSSAWANTKKCSADNQSLFWNNLRENRTLIKCLLHCSTLKYKLLSIILLILSL